MTAFWVIGVLADVVSILSYFKLEPKHLPGALAVFVFAALAALMAVIICIRQVKVWISPEGADFLDMGRRIGGLVVLIGVAVAVSVGAAGQLRSETSHEHRKGKPGLSVTARQSPTPSVSTRLSGLSSCEGGSRDADDTGYRSLNDGEPRSGSIGSPSRAVRTGVTTARRASCRPATDAAAARLSAFRYRRHPVDLGA
jgi:hypothetical protein